jgi:hypothetical protein
MHCIQTILLPVLPTVVDAVVVAFFISRWMSVLWPTWIASFTLQRTDVVRYSYHAALATATAMWGACWLWGKVSKVLKRVVREAHEAQGLVVTRRLRNRR